MLFALSLVVMTSGFNTSMSPTPSAYWLVNISTRFMYAAYTPCDGDDCVFSILPNAVEIVAVTSDDDDDADGVERGAVDFPASLTSLQLVGTGLKSTLDGFFHVVPSNLQVLDLSYNRYKRCKSCLLVVIVVVGFMALFRNGWAL
jgi:hypothetical protein